MPIREKISICLIVLAAGLAAAMLFRRAQEPQHEIRISQANARTERRADEAPDSPAVQSTPVAPPKKRPPEDPASSTATSPQTHAQTDRRLIVPSLASRYDLARNVPQAPSLETEEKKQPDAAGERDRSTAGKPLRRHRVVDGDTLVRLAKRYLGDGARYAEILEANRQVLSDPDLLPIGIELKIPPREGSSFAPTPAGDTNRAANDSAPAATASGPSPKPPDSSPPSESFPPGESFQKPDSDGLVPVPPAPSR